MFKKINHNNHNHNNHNHNNSVTNRTSSSNWIYFDWFWMAFKQVFRWVCPIKTIVFWVSMCPWVSQNCLNAEEVIGLV